LLLASCAAGENSAGVEIAVVVIIGGIGIVVVITLRFI
jgi:hypothetical protein